jgi:hypothetical protein
MAEMTKLIDGLYKEINGLQDKVEGKEKVKLE